MTLNVDEQRYRARIRAGRGGECVCNPRMLEAILIAVGQIDMKSLFVLQGINTTFRDTIERSRKLRRIMFLENTNNKDDTELIFNPLCLTANTTCALSPS